MEDLWTHSNSTTAGTCMWRSMRSSSGPALSPDTFGSGEACTYNRATCPHNTRTGRDALPFCSLRLKSSKPLSDQYPKEISTLGDHIRKRRLDLRLLQREVAEKIGVNEQTISNWERQRIKPEIRFIARIIEFLGYDPLPQPESFPEKLKTYRLRMGLSQKKLAVKLGIDPSTITRWEISQYRPANLCRKLLDKIFNEKCKY